MIKNIENNKKHDKCIALGMTYSVVKIVFKDKELVLTTMQNLVTSKANGRIID